MAAAGTTAGTVIASSESRFSAGTLVASLLTLLACTDEVGSGEPVAPARAPAAAEAPDPYERSPSRFGSVPLHAGFSPDPRVVAGTAIGEVQARSVHRKCRGWISETPDYLLDADTAFFMLHVLARSRSDLVLVVRKPDGAVHCNDNRNGTKHPMVRSAFPIGSSQVWVGVQKEGETADYRLGFSEVKWKSSSIPLPAAD